MRIFQIGPAARSKSAIAADSFVALLFLTIFFMMAFAATAFAATHGRAAHRFDVGHAHAACCDVHGAALAETEQSPDSTTR